MTDAEITAAVAVVTRLLRDREDGTDDEVFALEVITALRGHGWRPTGAKSAAPPLHAAPLPDKRSRDEELAALRAEMAAKAAAAREAGEGAA